MGATLPADGYITNAARTTGQVQNALDDTLNVVRRMIGAAAGVGLPRQSFRRFNRRNRMARVPAPAARTAPVVGSGTNWICASAMPA